jgi:hypothetical protein
MLIVTNKNVSTIVHIKLQLLLREVVNLRTLSNPKQQVKLSTVI